MPLLYKLALGVLTGALLFGGLGVLLLVQGQTDVIAWLVVGAVLVVVFGTPLLCLVGLIVFFLSALSRAGQRRYLPPRPRPTPPPEHLVIVGEVVFDD